MDSVGSAEKIAGRCTALAPRLGKRQPTSGVALNTNETSL